MLRREVLNFRCFISLLFYLNTMQVHSDPLIALVVVCTVCPLPRETLVVPTTPWAFLMMGAQPSGSRIYAFRLLMELRSSVSGISLNENLY